MTSPNSAPHRHMIVGDGITAAAFAEGCRLSPGDELIILGRNASQLGRGAAYPAQDPELPWSYAYLLNSPADDIDPAFARWLEENWADIATRMEGRKPNWLRDAQDLLDRGDTYGVNAPRAFYGDFMEQEVGRILSGFRDGGVTVTIVDAEAETIRQTPTGLQVTTAAGQTFDANAVDIAPGGPSTQRFIGDDGPFSAPTLFGQEARIAEHIKAGAEIFCIGANATMLDVLRLCQSLIPEEHLNLVACSPGGTLPPPLVPSLPRKLTKPRLKPGHETAESFLAEVWSAMEQARAAGREMRSIRAGFRAYFIEHGLHQFVPDDAEARKVPLTLRHWLRGGTRDTIEDFHRLMKLGKCRTIGGRIFAIEATAHGAQVRTRDKAGNVTTLDTGFVVNCSGAGKGSTYDPLTSQMLEEGWLHQCPVTGGLETGENCATGLPNVRHLSPATTVIGAEVMPMPLYDAHLLRTWAKRAVEAQR